MAQNVTVAGASYTAVPAVDLPKTGGGTATFTDTSPTTAVESDVASGKIFFKADGSQATGTGSGADCPTFTVTVNSGWTAVTSVTCDKTYSECFALYEDGNSLAVFHIVDNGNEYDVGAGMTDSITGGLRYAAASSEIAWLIVDFSSNGTITGTLDPIPFRDSTDLTASTLTVTAPAGYYESNATKTLSDQNLIAANIKKDISIFGVTGSYEGGGGTTWGTTFNGTVSVEDWGEDLYYAFLRDYFTTNPVFAFGDTYRITWGLNQYTCVVQEYDPTNDSYMVGNAVLFGGSTGNNEPFVLVQAYDSDDILIGTTTSPGTVNLKIEKQVQGGGSVLVQKTITANGTYDPADDDADGYSEVTVAIPAGTEGTRTATKGTVSNHSISVTPSVTNSAGVIAGGTHTGTAVTVSVSELESGNKEISANGTNISVSGYSTVSVAVPSSGSKNVQTVQSTSRRNNTALGSITSLTCSTTGTYDVYWTCARSNTSQTWGSQLYIGGSAYDTENTTWSNNVQNNHLENVSISANQTVAVYGRSRSGYYIYAPQLTIVQK